MIDLGSNFGQRVERRLRDEWIAWFTTIDSAGAPQPRPVWFHWDGQRFLIYSRPGAAKLRHIERNPRASLHLDGDGRGGDIVVFSGVARLDESAPPSDQLAGYVAKYAEAYQRIGRSPAEFAAQYSVALEFLPTALRGH